MNREIKFRAWDTVYKAMQDCMQWAPVDEGFEVFSDQRYIFMQYTGLKDKNGKEIYEGDIVQVFYHDRPQTEENKAYTVVIRDMMEDHFLGVGNEHGEVIGNIHENPELLKGGDSDE